MNQYQQQQDVTTTVAAQYNQATTTTSMMAEQTTMMMAEQTTMMMADTTTTSMMAETTVMAQEVTTTAASYSMPSYGSGSNSWNSGYNNCVQRAYISFIRVSFIDSIHRMHGSIRSATKLYGHATEPGLAPTTNWYRCSSYHHGRPRWCWSPIHAIRRQRLHR